MNIYVIIFIYMTKISKAVKLKLYYDESVLVKMKLWHAANIYWLILITYICYRIYDRAFETDVLGPTATWGLIAVVVLAAIVMIGEFQLAWYVWLKGFRKKSKDKYK